MSPYLCWQSQGSCDANAIDERKEENWTESAGKLLVDMEGAFETERAYQTIRQLKSKMCIECLILAMMIGLHWDLWQSAAATEEKDTFLQLAWMATILSMKVSGDGQGGAQIHRLTRLEHPLTDQLRSLSTKGCGALWYGGPFCKYSQVETNISPIMVFFSYENTKAT